MTHRLPGKIALVTGAASGIGRGTALAAEGATVVITDVDAVGLAAYCVTEGAVRLLTKAVALECAQAGMTAR